MPVVIAAFDTEILIQDFKAFLSYANFDSSFLKDPLNIKAISFPCIASALAHCGFLLQAILSGFLKIFVSLYWLKDS